jgi:hypothetical protein
MLTTAQTVLVAVQERLSGEVICVDCFTSYVEREAGEEVTRPSDLRFFIAGNSDEWLPIIEYTLHEEYNQEGYGVICDQCGKELAAPCCAECGQDITEENCTDRSTQSNRDGIPFCNDCWEGED